MKVCLCVCVCVCVCLLKVVCKTVTTNTHAHSGYQPKVDFVYIEEAAWSRDILSFRFGNETLHSGSYPIKLSVV